MAIRADDGSPGVCKLDGAVGVQITFTDTGDTPVSRLWSFVFEVGADGTVRNPFAPAYPSTLSSPPTIGTATAATATWTPTLAGYYAIKLRRETLPGVYEFEYLAIRVADENGQALPSPGFHPALLNSDPETGYRGWGGTLAAPGQDAAIRQIQGDVADLQDFEGTATTDITTLQSNVTSLQAFQASAASDITTLQSDVTNLQAFEASFESSTVALGGESTTLLSLTASDLEFSGGGQSVFMDGSGIGILSNGKLSLYGAPIVTVGLVAPVDHALFDADATINVSSGSGWYLDVGTLTNNRTLRLGATGATGNDLIELTISRFDTTAHTYAVVDDGTSATIYTFASGTSGKLKVQWDDVNGQWLRAGLELLP